MPKAYMWGDEFVTTLKVAREEHGWSQGELAARAGVSRPTIARLETGRHVGLASLERVAAVRDRNLTVSVAFTEEMRD